MKYIIFSIVLSGYTLFAAAQYRNSDNYQIKNVIKFQPVTLPFNSVSFEYERMINNKNSVTLQVGFPNQKSVMGKFGISANSDLKTAEFGSTIIRGAYRHYTGENRLPSGFYIEPYMKYQQLKGDATIAGMDDQGDPYSGRSDVKFNTVNMGCQLGIQFLIAKRVCIDIYFLGMEGGILNGTIATTPTSYTAYDPIILSVIKNVIDQNIAQSSTYIRNKVTTTQTSTQVLINAKSAVYPWIRGGFSIGFAF